LFPGEPKAVMSNFPWEIILAVIGVLVTAGAFL
jgi:hypothetical protein